VPSDADLAKRIRACLHEFEVREVAMFGGRSFMIHDQLAVAAASDGDLLLRCNPDRVGQLLRRDGARVAEMRGRPMSAGWIRVAIDEVQDDAVLQQWVNEAVAHTKDRTS